MAKDVQMNKGNINNVTQQGKKIVARLRRGATVTALQREYRCGHGTILTVILMHMSRVEYQGLAKKNMARGSAKRKAATVLKNPALRLEELRAISKKDVPCWWECTGCGFEYHQCEPPSRCPKCVGVGTFEKIEIKRKISC